MRSDDPDQCLAAVADLAEAGAVEPLCRALNHPDEQVRLAAARALGTLGGPAIEALTELLDCGSFLQPRKAAWALGFCGSEALKPLVQALRSSDSEVRNAAFRTLRRLKRPETTRLLCEMLRDGDYYARSTAAWTLGEIGDERAIGPLCKALRSCFVGRSAERQLRLGLLVAIGWGALFCVAMGAAFESELAGAGGFLFGSMAGFTSRIHSYFASRRQTGDYSRAVTKALVQIGERTPTPELRRVLPDLRVVAKDRLQHDPRTREASRAAVERIEALTENLKDLPLPGGTSVDEASLPRVGQAPHSDADHLPRVR
ncbi:MAG: HEAT repeat domain-containing protein [Armatimonadota bacterium]